MSLAVASPDTFRKLLLADTPFLDVRAEVEFVKGSIPGSHNLPILNTDERHLVGSRYKQQGQQQAIALGHQLVSGDLKAQRVNAWCEFARSHPGAHLYCWRGGMRSNLSQQWMQAAGVDIPLITGGYKALRRVLLEEIDATVAQTPLLIIGGKTGSAKTLLINSLPNGVDLEHFANHRGSSFGRRVIPPPSQADFENALAIELLKKRSIDVDKPLFLEDESHLIGPCALPLPLFTAMKAAPLILLDVPFQDRVQHVLQEYVMDMRTEYEDAYGEQGYQHYGDYLLASLSRIKKRLGMQRYQQLETIMQSALADQLQRGDCSGHRAWIEVLLRDYYDPMYEYQLDKVKARVVFSGDRQAVSEWASNH